MHISLLAVLPFCALSMIVPAYAASPVACTMDAKLCPDGVTYVGRDGSRNCQWQLCPGEKDSCAPYACNDGTRVDRCAADGTVINYFAAPCLTHGGEIDASQSFSDVPALHPNAEAIAYVKAQGIVEGYYDGTYRPDVPLVRAEFVKIVGSYVFGRDVANQCGSHMPFPDVLAHAWYARYVCRAYEAHLINGYPNGLFVPAKNINVVEAIKIVALAHDFGNHNSDLDPKESNPWYERYFRYLAERNAIPISVTSFDEWLTRGEMAEVIYRLRTGNTDKPSQTYEELAMSVQSLSIR